MRKDVKAGLVLALGVVALAGWYYRSGDRSIESIPLNETNAAGMQSTSADAAAGTTPRGIKKTRDRGERVARGNDPRSQDRRARQTRNPVPKRRSQVPAERQDNRSASTGKPVASGSLTAKGAEPSRGNKSLASARTRPEAEALDRASRTTTTDPSVPTRRTGGVQLMSKGRQTADKSAGIAPKPGTPLAAKAGTASTTGPVAPSADRRTPGRSTDPKPVVKAGGPGPQKPASAMETHVIQRGDTFARLAEVYYGDPGLATLLIEANKTLGDPRRLQVGAVVQLPPRPAPKKAGVKTAPATVSATGRDEKNRDTLSTYEVQPGDSFYRIAERRLGAGSRWEELFELNRSVVDGEPRKLRPGQILRLPTR